MPLKWTPPTFHVELNFSFLAFLHDNNFEMKDALYEKWKNCILDNVFNKLSVNLTPFVCRCTPQWLNLLYCCGNKRMEINRNL